MPYPYRNVAFAGVSLCAAAAAIALAGGCAAVPAAASQSWSRSDYVKKAPSAAPSAASSIEPYAARAHPLTGLPMEGGAASGEALTQRPIMVMVNNHAAARPQSGLSGADVLVECLAEGEITRIAAFFEGGNETPGMIGPVRSIRPYYIDLGRMFDAIEVHAGGSPDAYAQLDGEHIDHLDEITNAGRFFRRESFRKLPHNLYTDMAHLRAGAAKLGVRAEPRRSSELAFAQAGTRDMDAAAGPAPGDAETKGQANLPTQQAERGSTAAHLDVAFLHPSYAVSYDYDAGDGLYRRSVNGRPDTDLNDGARLTAANIVVLGADHKILDAEGRREVRLTGSGPAVVFRRGKAVQGTWRRREAADTFHLTAADGSRVALTPGKTHYLIVPNAPTFAGHVKY